jgi:hypothetical protein
MLLRFLDKLENFESLSKEVLDLWERLQPDGNQIVCQTRFPDSDDWIEGAGRIEELPEQEERKYQYINKEIQGSEIDRIVSKYNGFRARIMIMPSRKCYSVHSDPTPRIHIPILTNDQCWMIWPEASVCRRLRQGNVYWTNTQQSHTFINGSTKDRIHLIMGIDP